MNYKNFYKNKKILVTGSTGFKGSWLCYILYNFGSKVYGFSDSLNKDHLNYKILKLDKKITTFFGDVTDYKKINQVINKTKPEIIFHLAAQSLVKKSYNFPLQTFRSNSIGVLNVLDICRNTKFLKSIVIITSDKCYKNKESNSGYKESDEIGGLDPYSASKAVSENIFYSYLNSFYKNNKSLGIVSARAGNVIGGGDWSADRILPDYIKSLKYKKKFSIRSPQATRPWQHIFELINGYLILAHKTYGNNKFNGSWNFGPNKKNSISVIEMITRSAKLLLSKKKIFIINNKKNAETKNLFLNANKSNKLLNWHPKFDINQTLKFTCDWYAAFLKKQDLEKFSYKQFKKYFLI